jgi:glycosyltransferase involved in cell wall biosynthesis
MAGLEPVGAWESYNERVGQCLRAIEGDWRETIAAEVGCSAEDLPDPAAVGIFELTAADRISVVVPVFNEERTIVEVLDQLADVPAVTQIVVVNDASRDQTRERLSVWQRAISDSTWHERLPDGLVVLNHEVNQGKGAALRTGFAHVTQPWTGVQDADTEYDPADLMRLLSIARVHQVDVVYGSRFLLSETGNSPAWHRWGNRLITRLANLSFGTNFSDVETCYKLIKTTHLKAVSPNLRENRFGIEIELTARLSQLPGIEMTECPISYDRRTYAEGKKIGLRDAFRAVWCMARYR